MKKINIMTSCDENLIEYVFVQLKSIQLSLKDKQIDFYLFYHNICEDTLNLLKEYAEYFGNINFIRVYVENIEPYKELVNLSVNQIWPVEAYFALECQKYLPETIDRILYVDAGDVIFMRDIDEYYNQDFLDKHLIASPIIHNLTREDLLFYSEDLMNEKYLDKILYRGVFSSGSYIINLKKFRQENISLSNYLDVLYDLRKKFPKKEIRYFGDQGIMSLLFIGKINYWKIAQNENINLFYVPYNCMLGFDQRILKVTGTPKILHFVQKPWRIKDVRFKEEEIFYTYWFKLEQYVKLELKQVFLN